MQNTVTEFDDVDASFEAIYEQLETAVARLEEGGLSLEESIALYETGMRLARRCKEMLDSAELRVSELDRDLAPEVADQIDDDELGEDV
jgi:exodeoxyribonuclease VII small subunit